MRRRRFSGALTQQIGRAGPAWVATLTAMLGASVSGRRGRAPRPLRTDPSGPRAPLADRGRRYPLILPHAFLTAGGALTWWPSGRAIVRAYLGRIYAGQFACI